MTSPANLISMLDAGHELACIIIPTSGDSLLLPNVCVAEIVPWRRLKPVEEGPDWCLGLTGWRGLSIPVVDYPLMNESAGKYQPPARCLTVMNRVRTKAGPAFYAFAAQSLPRMVQLVREDLVKDDGNPGTMDLMRIQVGTEATVVPDLEGVERAVADLLNRVSVQKVK